MYWYEKERNINITRNYGMNAKLHHSSIRLLVLGRTMKAQLPSFTFMASNYRGIWHQRILFTDEKIFNIEEKFNCQNDHVYAKSCYEVKDKIPRVQISHSPLPSLLAMVWWGVSYSYTTQIHFYEWWRLLSHVKRCLAISGGNCIRGQRWVVLSGRFCITYKAGGKNARMVARAWCRFHQSGWLALLQPIPQSIRL